MTQHSHANDPFDLDGLEEVVRQGEWKEVSDRQEQLLALIQRLRKLERVREAADDLDYGKGSDALTNALRETE